MDNKGDVKGALNGNEGVFGAQEMLPNNAEGEKFDAFVDSREDLKPQIEMPAELIDNDNSAEVAGEMQPTDQPVAQPVAQDDNTSDDDKKNQEVKEHLSQIKVPRDAESLPKAYEKAVNDIVARNRKDPFRLVQEMDIARWDMMEKAFARKLGDGLTGTGGN
ncbi:hypothetical protein J6X15_00725 [Candidatus Saccharibacteria bacterium]|nr:hypothetical protein [Candidatus Saccharibacteria bacterium]MBP5656094.1 hypothetical protein [Candidatus Saccharibacteria bacterium]